MPFGQQSEHLAGCPKADRHALHLLQVHLEDVERHVYVGDSADAAALHFHDVARPERQQVAEPVHLVPELVCVLSSLIEMEILEQVGQVGFAVAVELVQGVENGVVDLSATHEVVCGAADEIQARGPHAAFPQLVVEELEERSHTILFAQSDESLGDGEELLDVEIAFDRGQPVRFYCVDVTARQAVLSALRDPHAVAGAAWASVGARPRQRCVNRVDDRISRGRCGGVRSQGVLHGVQWSPA